MIKDPQRQERHITAAVLQQGWLETFHLMLKPVSYQPKTYMARINFARLWL